LLAVVVTFDRPIGHGIGEIPQKVLMTREEKYAYLEQMGVDILLELTFREEIQRMSPEEFVHSLVDFFHLQYMICGNDFRFGYKGAGDVDLLAKCAAKYGFRLDIVDKLRCESREISSTFIREEIAAGHVENANTLLGYPYFVVGEIVHGNHIGSDRIGRPTINIHPPADKLLPPNGVYVTEAYLIGRKFHGVTNVGFRPSIHEKNKEIRIETHILDFDRNVYDQKARIVFLKFLRSEQAFSSMETLKAQIEADVRMTYQYFNEK
ncbi:MAG: riboflavin biosynthesis protein RibF, partial [Lachnospiraceae bacterium]|nr:riboflavin biosynthesis protein RibF [Lachnospiraceae bacterium]